MTRHPPRQRGDEAVGRGGSEPKSHAGAIGDRRIELTGHELRKEAGSDEAETQLGTYE